MGSRRSASPRRFRRIGRFALPLWLAAGCSFNPATGRLQLTTVSESQEISLGKEVDAEIVEAVGPYEDERLGPLVSTIGAELAAQSERPGLPWQFRVLDDPTVNAFALPGGFVYTTRGLLVHLSSKDELAAVLGHEIGHVTARHGVVQLRKSRVAAASVGLFRIVDPNLRHVGGIAASTAGLALLKYSRDDEYEADSLGLRYVGRAGYDRAATVGVFDVLIGVGKVEQGERVPTWLSTHPEPEVRRTRVRSLIPGKADPPGPDPDYIALLDGVIYGMDPRDGFILGQTFVHPNLGFQVDLPPEWKAVNEGAQVMASSPDEQALLVLTPNEAKSADEALEEFFADGSLTRGEDWKGEVAGFHVASAGFSVSTSSGPIYGLLAFIDYGEQVIAMAALGPAEGWEARSEVIATCFASFRRADPKLRGVEPMRVRVMSLPRAMSLTELHGERPSVIELPRLALLNGVTVDAVLPEGTAVKRVEGFDPSAFAAPSTTPAPGTPP